MSARCAFSAVSSVFLLSLAGCGYLGIGGSAPSAQAPTPAISPSPATKSPPVLPLVNAADVPSTPATPEEDDTARLLAQKIAAYAKEMPSPPHTDPSGTAAAPDAANHPSGAPSPDAIMNLLSPDSLRLAPYNPTGDAPRAPQHPGDLARANGDVSLGSPESAELHSSGPGEHSAAGSPDQGWDHRLAQRVQEYPHDLDGQLDYQLLEFLQDRPVPDMATVSALSSEDREVVSALMDGLSNFRNGIRADNNMLLSKKIAPLVEMTDRLKQQAELTLPTVALCTSVHTFGDYTPVKDAKFQAGRDNEVIVYCEVQNFASRPNVQGLWETKLTLETVLYTEAGDPVWPDKSDAQPVDDLCRNRRHDFFIRRKITLPANLPIQRYLLKVTVTDQEVNRIAEATTPVEMVSQVDSGN